MGSASATVGNKNLFDVTPLKNLEVAGVTITWHNDDTIELNGTYTGSSPSSVNNTMEKTINTNGIMSMQIISGSVTGDFRFNLFDRSHSWYNNWVSPTNTNYNKITDDYVFDICSLTIFGNTSFNHFRIGLQVVKGNTAPSSYTPHKHQTYTIPTQQPMRKISDYADTFVRENGQWYEKHVISEIVLDGSENAFIYKHISIYTDTNGFYQCRLLNKTTKLSNGSANGALCNYLMLINNSNASQAINSTGIWWEGRSNNIYASLPFTSLENVNNWLKSLYELGKPLSIIYILQEPTLLPCTPEQTAVLEEIRKKAKTYKGGTHIYSTDEVSPIFDVEYHVDQQSENENLQSQLESLEARVSLLEGGE